MKARLIGAGLACATLLAAGLAQAASPGDVAQPAQQMRVDPHTGRRLADAPESPLLGPVEPGRLGGYIPGAVPDSWNLPQRREPVADTGKLQTSPPLGPAGPTGGVIPSAKPGWTGSPGPNT